MTKRQIKKKRIQQKINKDVEPDFVGYINAELTALAKKSVKTVKQAGKGASALCRSVREDVNAVRERDPAARSNLEVLLLYSGVHALIAHRIAHGLYLREHYFSARAISQLSRAVTGIEIHPGATIGKGLMIDHGMGVVIGETAEIGDNCTIYQGVTLGGTGKEKGKRHPTIKKGAIISAGAKVLGGFTVGEYAKIGAGAVVLKEVPPYATVVGVPGIVVRINGEKMPDLEQEKTDPIQEELCHLRERLFTLEEELNKLKNKD